MSDLYHDFESGCAYMVGIVLFIVLGGALMAGICILIAWSRGTLLLIPLAIGIRGLFREDFGKRR